MKQETINHEKYIKKCHELAIKSGKNGFDSFGAIVVHDGKILESAENTADYDKGLFGHAEFNVVHKCANKYSDKILKESILYTSCAPCERCIFAILSLGINNIVYSVSYDSFAKLLPFTPKIPDYKKIFKEMNIDFNMHGPILEEEGMKVFEYWGGEHKPLEKLLAEAEEMRKNNK